jgi:transposase
MLGFRLSLSRSAREELENKLKSAERKGDIRLVKRIWAIWLVCAGYRRQEISSVLKVCEESIRLWVGAFLLKGVNGLVSRKPPGRPPNLTKTQRKELERIIEGGPWEAGFCGNCWRSPMIQHLIYERFGVLYSVYYISQLLKNMCFSYQKARFVSDHLDEEARKQWMSETWPRIKSLAKQKDAHILFGDEASFPQWGTLTYTWAKRGQQPTVKTSGKRKGYKVFGLIDYFTGKFFFKCQEERFNSDRYAEFLKEVLSKTSKHIILIQDGARYHTSAAMKEFFAQNKDRLTVFQLPSYSPDFNPIERLWKKVKEDGTHLHYFPTFQDLKDKVEEILGLFKNAPKEILPLFGMYKELAQTA